MASAVVLMLPGQVATEPGWYVAQAIVGIEGEEREVVKVVVGESAGSKLTVFAPGSEVGLGVDDFFWVARLYPEQI